MDREETMWSLGCRQQVKGRLKIILLCSIHSHLILKQALSRRRYSVSSHSMLSKKLDRTSQDCLSGSTINSHLSWSFQSFEIMKLKFPWLIKIRGLKMKFK